MSTISGTFSGDGVSNVLRLRGAPEVVSISVAGGYTGEVFLERSKAGSELAWERVLGPFNSATGFSGAYHALPLEVLRLRARGFSGSSAYSMQDGDAVLFERRNSENEVVMRFLESGDRIYRDLHVDGTLYIGGVAYTPSPVSSVFGRTGAIVAANGDYTAANITNVPAGTVAATTVQAAINEISGDVTAEASARAAADTALSGDIATEAAARAAADTALSGDIATEAAARAAADTALDDDKAPKANPTFTGVALGADGSASAPSWSFSGDADLGFYRVGSNNIGLSLGNFLAFSFLGVASPVNYLEYKPAATGGGPELTAKGTDTDVPIKLTPKGSGYVHITATGLKFPDGTNQTTAASASGGWEVKTTTYTAASGDRILADMDGGAWSLTMPASPSAGDWVEIMTHGNDVLTILRNSELMDGVADDLAVPAGENLHFTLVYKNGTDGWVRDGGI